MQESVVDHTIDSDKEQLQAVILAAREVEEYYKRTPPFMWSTCYRHGLPEENLLIDTNLDEVSDPSRQNFLTSTEEIGICRVVENPRRGADGRYPRIRATARFLAHAILDHVKQKFTFNFEKGDKTLLRKAVHVITAMEKRKRLKIIRKLIYRRRKATAYLMALRKKVKPTKIITMSPSNGTDTGTRTRQTFMTSTPNTHTRQTFMTSTPNTCTRQTLMTSTPKSQVTGSNLFSLNISPCKRRWVEETDDKPPCKRRRQHGNATPSMTPRRLDRSFTSYAEETSSCCSDLTGFNPGQQLSPSAPAVDISSNVSILDRSDECRRIQLEKGTQTILPRNEVTWLRSIPDEATADDMRRPDNTEWLFYSDSSPPVEVLTSFEPSNTFKSMGDDLGKLSTNCNTPNTASLSDSLVDDSIVLNYKSTALPLRLPDVNTVQPQANNKPTNITKISERLANFRLDFSTKHEIISNNAAEPLTKLVEFETVTESHDDCSCSIAQEENFSTVDLSANHDPSFLQPHTGRRPMPTEETSNIPYIRSNQWW